MRRTPMAKDCLYCGLQFTDTTQFCPNCGRLIESGFSIRLRQESEVDCLRRELKEKDELIRQLILTRTMRGEASHAIARSTGRRRLCGSDWEASERKGAVIWEDWKEEGDARSILVEQSQQTPAF